MAELLEEGLLVVEPSVVKVLLVVALELVSPVQVVGCLVALGFVVLPVERAVECAVEGLKGPSGCCLFWALCPQGGKTLHGRLNHMASLLGELWVLLQKNCLGPCPCRQHSDLH